MKSSFTRLRLRRFLLRMYIIPFESGVVMLIMYGAGITLLDYGVSQASSPLSLAMVKALGPVATQLVAVVTLLAGICTILGLGIPRRDIEASGLIAVVAIILIRSVVLTSAIGFGAAIVNVWVSNVIFSVACCARLHSILSHRQALIVHVNDIVEIR